MREEREIRGLPVEKMRMAVEILEESTGGITLNSDRPVRQNWLRSQHHAYAVSSRTMKGFVLQVNLETNNSKSSLPSLSEASRVL